MEGTPELTLISSPEPRAPSPEPRAMKPPVLVTTRMPSVVMQRLEESCAVDLNDGGDLTEDELIARLHDKQGVVSVFINQVTRRVIESAPHLRVVANVAVGYNNIDVQAARERGVVVTNTPDVLP